MKLMTAGVAAACAAAVCLPIAAHAAPAVLATPTQPAAAKVAGPTKAQRTAANMSLARYTEVADRSYWTMAPGNNCTNYVAWRLIDQGMSPNVTWLHNASEWGYETREHGIPVNHKATVGSIAQWNAGTPGSSSGHVAYVEAVSPDWILVSEDNYSSGPRHLELIRAGTPEWPSNFIHFPTKKAVTSQTQDAWKQFLQTYYDRW